MTKIYTAPSSIQGTGCYAGRDIKKGERIGEYTGPQMTEDEADEKYAESDQTYLFLLDDGTVIDATDEPNPVKYINHSCDGNCEAFEEDGRVIIYAAKDIAKDEELHYDYQLTADDDDEDLTCNCGSHKCRGTMRGDHEK